MMTCTQAEEPKTSVRPDFPITHNKLYINGEWRDSINGKTFPVIDPTTEEELTQVAEGTVEDVEAAVQGARQAF